MEPTIFIDATTKIIITIVQILGGLTMILAIWISFRQLQLQKKEVIAQNQRVIELLEDISSKLQGKKPPPRK